MYMAKKQAADLQSGSFLLTTRLCLLIVACQLVSMLWLKMASLVLLNLFSVDTEVDVGGILWKKCFHRKTPAVRSLFQ